MRAIMSTRTRLIVFFASIPVIAFTLIGGYLGRVSAGEIPTATCGSSKTWFL